MGEHCSKACQANAATLCMQGLLRPAIAAQSPTQTPLPRCLHRSLSRQEVCRGGRLIVVGDVHGCAQELRHLLEKACFDKRRDTLIFVGDLVNKGPASGEVVRIARQAGAFCVRGNHEDDLLEAWYRVGRYKNGLANYKHHNTLNQVSRSDVMWIQELPLSLSLPWLPMLIVHAGMVPGIPLKQQTFRDLLWLRDVRQGSDGSLIGLESPAEGSFAWAKMWQGPEHVIFGHDAKRKLQERTFATGLDTGCCYGFHLTAVVLEEPENLKSKELWQVTAERQHSVPRDSSSTGLR